MGVGGGVGVDFYVLYETANVRFGFGCLVCYLWIVVGKP